MNSMDSRNVRFQRILYFYEIEGRLQYVHTYAYRMSCNRYVILQN